MIGQRIAHYQVIEKLGQGGMGEVYLAEDTSLERKVALKFLPLSLQEDKIAHKRFLREAKSAAAIEHPYICNIKEVGKTTDGQDFIVMEYVEGQTLKDRLEQGLISLKEAVRIGSEVTEALEKAHSGGVIHRDLKPSNIMLTPEGHAKVLDFGLAKRITRDKEDLTSALTREGSTLGTLAYMSPEQVRGQPMDARTDIFSLGIIFYEMLSGVHPFSTGTQAETVNAILSQDPSPLTRYVSSIPNRLQHTVEKMLAKEPGKRYQAIHEVGTNLTKVQEEITAPRPLALPAQRPGWRLALAILATLTLTLIAVWWHFGSQSSETETQGMKTTLATAELGTEQGPDFSPDGTRFAYWKPLGSGRSEIRVRTVGGQRSLPLTDGIALDRDPVWSPDGRQIAFRRHLAGEKNGIYVVEALGGEETRVAELEGRHRRGVDWSPDGQSLAFSDGDEILLLDLKTRQRTPLTSPPEGKFDHHPRFSPDGSRLAFARVAVHVGDIYVIPVSGGEPRPLLRENWRIQGLTWTSNGDEIVFSSNREGPFTLWRIPMAGGDPKRIQIAGDGAMYPAVTKQGKTLAYSKVSSRMDIFRLDLQGDVADRKAVPVVASTQTDGSPHISPDGDKVAFGSGRTGRLQIWVCKSDGSDPVKLTDFEAPDTSAPAWSPDGKLIAFNSNLEGNYDIYRMDVAGGPARQLTTHSRTDAEPNWSRDGEWIYFWSNRTGRAEVWKIRADGGEPIQVTTTGGWTAQESPDGKYLYYVKRDLDNRIPSLWQRPIEGGKETLVLDQVDKSSWAMTNRGIYNLNLYTESPSIQFLDFGTGELSRVADLTVEPPTGVARILTVSPQEDWLLFTGYHGEADIMLVENFR